MSVGPRLYSERLGEALAYAADLHATQKRKGTAIPYLSHLLAVCSLVLENGGSEDQAIAALLHDAAEDQGGQATLDAIRATFGYAVAKIVEDCSDSLVDSAVAQKADWELRKRAYLEHLGAAGAPTLLVSLADKLHNARSIECDYRRIGPLVFERFTGGRDGTLWYYDELVKAFERAAPPDPRREPMLAQLREIVARLHH